MNKIKISLVFAQSPHDIWQKQMLVNHGDTVIKAIEKSGFLTDFPYFSFNNLYYGVYGLIVSPDAILKENDRIEIYRELVFDPMQSRRRRAKLKQTGKKKKTRSRPSKPDLN